MTNPVVDLIGDRTGPHRADLPAVREGRRCRPGSSATGWPRRCGGRPVRASPTRCPTGCSTATTSSPGAEAFAGIHAPESMAHKRGGPPAASCSTSCCGCSSRWSSASGTSSARPAGIAHVVDGAAASTRFLARLPFDAHRPTSERPIAEIAADLAAPHPMHRLLQGDVGAGKTVVAVCDAARRGAGRPPGRVHGADRGAGRAARPRHPGAARRRRACPTTGASLFGARPRAGRAADQPDRRRPTGDASSPAWPTGEVDIVIGTHALIQEGVELPLARASWSSTSSTASASSSGPRCATRPAGGAVPDVLVMTATPIPRTAAMTVYGDLDVTVIRSRPAGPPADRHHAGRAPRPTRIGVWAAVRARGGGRAPGLRGVPADRGVREARGALGRGHVRRARRRRARRAAARPAARAVAPAEKEATMAPFRAGELDVLVATTVIEVGVDVPNATVMVILDADRFGIAQLHQLRGRVGRGSEQSWCYLVSASDTPEAEARLDALVETDRRVRAGRGRPRPAGRGHDHGRAPEGPQRPQAGLAAPRPASGSSGPARWPSPSSTARTRRRLEATPTCSTRSRSSSTTRTRSSCSRAERAVSPRRAGQGRGTSGAAHRSIRM